MVLFRGETSEQGDIIEERRGTEWRGAKVEELGISIYPADADVPLEPQQKHIRKRGSLTVLGRLES